MSIHDSFFDRASQQRRCNETFHENIRTQRTTNEFVDKYPSVGTGLCAGTGAILLIIGGVMCPPLGYALLGIAGLSVIVVGSVYCIERFWLKRY